MSSRVAAAALPVATAITGVFGDGQRLTAIALDYGRAIDGASGPTG